MLKFEKLQVWQESLVLIKNVYDLSKKLPKSEERNLIDQLKRATVSISLNIAEGTGAQNDKEFCRYLYIAKRSLFEVIAILKIITYIYKIETKEIEEEVIKVAKLLNGLIKYLNKSHKTIV